MLNNGGQITKNYKNFNARAVSLPASAVNALASRSDIGYVALDRDLKKLGHVTLTTGADAASAMGGSCDVELGDGCPPCVNDAGMTELIHNAAIASVGEQAVDSSEEVMTTGSDDMACFLESVPGCYFIVGANNPEKGAKYPHHHPRFNIDEDALPRHSPDQIAAEGIVVHHRRIAHKARNMGKGCRGRDGIVTTHRRHHQPRRPLVVGLSRPQRQLTTISDPR